MSNYDFDQITDRRNTGSLKWDVAENELPMWVADMDFQTAPAVREAIEKRAAHGVFGYTDVEEDWYQADALPIESPGEIQGSQTQPRYIEEQKHVTRWKLEGSLVIASF